MNVKKGKEAIKEVVKEAVRQEVQEVKDRPLTEAEIAYMKDANRDEYNRRFGKK